MYRYRKDAASTENVSPHFASDTLPPLGEKAAQHRINAKITHNNAKKQKTTGNACKKAAQTRPAPYNRYTPGRHPVTQKLQRRVVPITTLCLEIVFVL